MKLIKTLLFLVIVSFLSVSKGVALENENDHEALNIWASSISKFDNLEVKYLYGQRGNSQQSTIKHSRMGELERFEFNKDKSNISNTWLNKPFRKFVQIHGDSIFYYHDLQRNTGCIRHEFEKPKRHGPLFYLSYLELSTSEKWELVKADEENHIYTFERKEKIYKGVYRSYQLDPSNGMMPVEIIFYVEPENKPRRIKRRFAITDYTRTESGTYLPGEINSYSQYSQCGDTTPREIGFQVKLIEFRDAVEFPDDEFHYEFPPGTKVTDYRLNKEYTVN